jgi:hypothetical protein
MIPPIPIIQIPFHGFAEATIVAHLFEIFGTCFVFVLCYQIKFNLDSHKSRIFHFILEKKREIKK